MRILIVSDTHGDNDNLFSVIEEESPIDMLIHCGDIEGAEDYLEEIAGCPCYMVRGNNDFFSSLPSEEEFYVGKYKVFLTHGHYYYVYMDNEKLKNEAKDRGADIVMYGHIHRPVVERDKDIISVNPGSLTYPRQEGRRPSYIIMTVSDGKEPSFEIKYL